jgi:hypothetical protein
LLPPPDGNRQENDAFPVYNTPRRAGIFAVFPGKIQLIGIVRKYKATGEIT